MTTHAASALAVHVNASVSGEHPDLRQLIERAAHLLPAQGPITVFIHHNTLHAFEDLSFNDAVKRGARVFGCQPYLTEERYHEELARGRIRFLDLQAVLRDDLAARADQKIAGLVTRLELRHAMLQYRLRYGPTEELHWFVAETDALRLVRDDVSAALRARLIAETRRWVMRDLRGGNEDNSLTPRSERRAATGLAGLLERFGEARIESWSEADWEAFSLQALWRVCSAGVAAAPDFTPPPPVPVRPRDLLYHATGCDSDLLVHDVLIRYTAAFLDQGFAHWELTDRDQGFFQAFCSLYRQPLGPPGKWRRALAVELARLQDARIQPLNVLKESLILLGIDESEWEAFLAATLLALPGWAGMVHQVEVRGDSVRHAIPPGSLIEFLAVRLLLERFALAETARDALGYTGPLNELRTVTQRRLGQSESPSVEQRTFLLFQLAQVLGWTPPVLHALEANEWAQLVEEIQAFSSVERRRCFHLAYERRFVTQSLDAVALHQRTNRSRVRPRFQATFCIDDREESIRRHLEEVAPDAETFGVAGFFGVAMYYRGAGEAHFVPLCPIVVKPNHWVVEQVVDDLAEDHERRARARRAIGTAYHQFHVGSRSVALGALLTAGFGVLASIPLVARILFPRLTAHVSQLFNRYVQPPRTTMLKIERLEPTPGSENGQIGYSIDEMADVAERQLRDIGLTSGFARLVFLIGHGSSSLNNPHKSAYDCGACGGSPGAANGRALARMLNDARVRERLAHRGLIIPDDTVFFGGLHNTCNDSLQLYELDSTPESHRAELTAAQRDLEAALERNAHERCRRFMSAPLTLSFADARRHVEARSEDLAQTRPELGHATNALCIVGRRLRSRGLFFDRRAFLTSYDPTQDDAHGTILTRLLSAVVPVCAGINLEYYFSRVDNPGFGCGTKLPHNVSALLGVMNGAASDLRTGLPWQMVEIHEPVRLLFILETTPEIILGIMERYPAIGQTFRHGWALLAVQDPTTGTLQMYRDGAFHPYEPEAERLPQAASSVDWYRGWREHLEFAELVPTEKACSTNDC